MFLKSQDSQNWKKQGQSFEFSKTHWFTRNHRCHEWPAREYPRERTRDGGTAVTAWGDSIKGEKEKGKKEFWRMRKNSKTAQYGARVCWKLAQRDASTSPLKIQCNTRWPINFIRCHGLLIWNFFWHIPIMSHIHKLLGGWLPPREGSHFLMFLGFYLSYLMR